MMGYKTFEHAYRHLPACMYTHTCVHAYMYIKKYFSTAFSSCNALIALIMSDLQHVGRHE